MTDTVQEQGTTARSGSPEELLPPSFAQEQLWFVDRFHADLPMMHNVPVTVRLRGPLDAAALGRALDALVARHEPLRTRLVSGEDGRPYQVIDAPSRTDLAVADLPGPDAVTRLAEIVAELGARPFDLAEGPLFRTHLIRLAEDDHVLLAVAHGVVFDRGSAAVLVSDLAALYAAEVSGTPADLPALPERFADHARRERERLQGAELERLAGHWREVLDGFPNLQMPTDRPRPIVADHKGDVERLNLGGEVLAGLRELTRRAGTILPVTLLAALQTLLHRYSGQDEIVVGAANPNRRELAPLIGFLADVLPVRGDLSGDPAFLELLDRVGARAGDAHRHGGLPFARMVEELRVERDTGRPPVFQVGLTVAEAAPEVDAAGVTMHLERIGVLAARYDLEFFAEVRGDELWVELSYATALFDAATARRLLGNLRVLLGGVAEDPERRLSELPVLTETELHRELVEWNDTAADLPVICIHEGFERQVERAPEAIAAELDGATETYAGLNADANRIARRLRELGVGADVLVGVSMAPSIRRLAVLLGIMKAGGGYVPLDPALPADRLSFMIEDTGMPVVVADASGAGLPDGATTVVRLDREWDSIAALDDANPDYGAEPSDLAYVIYTSGSTGKPKGVMVEHRHAVNFLIGMIGAWRITPEDRVLQFASLNFDVSVMDMFMTLIGGARAVLASPETLLSPPRLADLIRDREVTFACMPPAIVNLLSGQDFPDLRLVLSAGEELSGELVRKWLRPGLEFYNGYGPTEASIGSCYSLIDGTVFPPPIGRPKPNYQAYVLDRHLNPVPVGVAGELHVGGAGVTRGYLNRPELTEERFIPDPFRPGGRLYKTGDLVRRMPDGNLVFLGRIDGQVKIRGLRVELGEIETGLVSHPAVAQAVVVVAEDRSGEKQLTGYVRFDPDGPEATVADLRQHLAHRLPAYMVPTYLVVLDAFPLTTNNKVDKAALPAPDAATEATTYAAPRTLLETVLADMYARLLGQDRIGIDDSFFDLGGNSLQAMQLITQLRSDLAVDLNVAAIFLAPTPRQLTVLLCDEHGLEDADAEAEGLAPGRTAAAGIGRRPADLTEPPPSLGQEQLWFIDRFAPGLPTYNIPNALRLSGPLDAAAFGRALDALVARHEALRTRLVSGEDGRPRQVIDEPSGASLTTVDLSGSRRAGEELAELCAAEAVRPFDLAEGPLFRTHLVRLGAEEHMLVVVVHHAVFDGWSIGVMTRDLAALYSAEVSGEPAGLADLPVQFADFALWERERLGETPPEDLVAYWRTVLADFPTLQLPTDRPRPALDTFAGGVEWLNLGAEALTGLRELSRREGTTLFVTLLAGLQVLLQRYSGQDDIVVGTVTANRDHAELTPIIGFLVNTLAIRTDLTGDPSFTELLGRVREATVGAYAHQELPFAKLVEELKVERDPGRAPVFQVGMTLAEPVAEVGAAGVTMQVEKIDLPAAKFDLAFLAEVRGDELWVELSYATALFDAATARRLLGNLRVVLAGAVQNPVRRLSELPVLTEAELRRELVEWNDTAADFPLVCVHEGFEQQVARTPDGIAAQPADGPPVTYAELNADANRIARRLRDLGVGADVLVGVSLAPSPRRLAVLLGIMKAGGGYVPLDPALPADRLSFMIEDTAMPVIVADAGGEAGLPGSAARLVSVEREWDEIAALDPANPGFGVRDSDLAYVIYTSGSTGKPKGVMVEHRHVVNFLLGMIRAWRITPGDRVLQFASLNFDVSVMDMFMTLLAGARAVIVPPETLSSPPRLADLMRERGVTFACLPPAVVNLLSGQDFPDLRLVLSAGEELSGELVRKWLRPGLELYNGYGPTEAAIGATFSLIDGTMFPPPIGRPKPNYQAYVLDRYLNPVPVGVAGELHIGGAGVTRGYLNAPELTEQRFVPDPFSGKPGARLYKTGDLVRRMPDGNLVFLGRIDGQVKIRGLRVELGEIETALVTHPAVAQAVVTLAEDGSGEKQLTGYVRLDPDEPAVDAGDIRRHLSNRLPAYMVPTYLLTVESFPLTTNGKVDKAALPAPGSVAETVAYTAPRTLVETVLADTYARLLGREQVGIDDGFFDTGGNSLQAMRLVTALRDDLAVDVDLAAIFLAPTPRRLTALLREEYGLEDEDLGDTLIAE